MRLVAVNQGTHREANDGLRKYSVQYVRNDALGFEARASRLFGHQLCGTELGLLCTCTRRCRVTAS